MFALALALTTWSQAIEVEIIGSCPGPTDIVITGATPGQQIAVVMADGPDAFPIEHGVCAGVVTMDIGPMGDAFYEIIRTDATGAITALRSIPTPGCGMTIQAVDLRTCETSIPVLVPGGTMHMIWAADASGAVAGELYRVDPATGDVLVVGPLVTPITDLAINEEGALFGIGGGWTSHGQIHRIDTEDASSIMLGTMPVVEASLSVLDGLFYAIDPFSSFVTFDPETLHTDTMPFGSGFIGTDLGYALTTDASGRLIYANRSEVYEVDPHTGDLTLLITIETIPPSSGGGATFHDGTLYLTADDPMGTQLYTVDLMTGEAMPTGLIIPSPAIDALASTGP